jgi:hypothetical protein
VIEQLDESGPEDEVVDKSLKAGKLRHRTLSSAHAELIRHAIVNYGKAKKLLRPEPLVTAARKPCRWVQWWSASKT